MKSTVKEKTRAATGHQTHHHPKRTVREAVGIFQDPTQLQAAIDELQIRGFMRQEISVLADEATIREKLGHLYKHVQLAEDDPKAPRMIFVSNEEISVAEAAAVSIPLFIAAVSVAGAVVASGGLLLDAIIYAAIAGGVGAGIGSMLATFIARHRAEYLEKQVESGGILLWVHAGSLHMEKLAQQILHKHSAEDVHIHDIPVYQ